jgi:endonuclease-3
MKLKNLRAMCRFLIDEYQGVVPSDRKGLMRLPGIGRKCADIVMSFTFGEDVIAVDTHVNRVCNRTGLAAGKTEAATAASLEMRSPEWAKRDGHFWLLQFGKKVCTSRAPKCETCPVNDLCLYFIAQAGGAA